jgi:heme a synthase
VFVAVLAFLLVVLGGLVTSNNAGLAVPDWPTSQGLWWLPFKKMVGGVKYEHGHRLVAEAVGLLTIIVAVWTWLVDKRRWMRALTVGAVAGVIFQGVLGGLTVLNFLPPAISAAHGVVGQTMFCALAAIAVFTSRSWMEEPTETITRADAAPLIRHSWMLIGFLYLQLILGASFRHVWTKWGPMGSNRWPAKKIVHLFLYPHMLNSLLVIGLIVFVSLHVMTKLQKIAHLKRPAFLLMVLGILQMMLGILAYVVRVIQGANESQPTAGLVGVTVAHQGTGALILGLTIVLTIQAYRHTRESGQVLPFQGREKVVSV